MTDPASRVSKTPFQESDQFAVTGSQSAVHADDHSSRASIASMANGWASPDAITAISQESGRL